MAGERSRGPVRLSRPVPLALAAIGLLGLVALAARGHPRAGGGGATRHVPGDLILEYIVLLLLAEAVVVLPLIAYSFWTNRYERLRRQASKRNWVPRTFAVMTSATIVLAAVYAIRMLRHDGSSGRARVHPPGLPPGGGSSGQAGTASTFDWMPAVVVGSLLVVGLVVGFLWLRRAEATRSRSPEEIAEELSHVLDDSLEDLRAEPDPRRAVIAAYARMERALAWFGLPRRAFEAPLEYLSRVLVDLRASAESVRRLTSLFERAKFSAHEIGPTLKEDAIDALVTVRDELRAYR